MKLNSDLAATCLFFFCCANSPATGMQQSLDLTAEDEITLQEIQSSQSHPKPTALQSAIDSLKYETVYNTLSKIRNDFFQSLINKPEAQHEAIFNAYRSELQAACDDAQTLEIIFGQTNPDIAEKAHTIIALLEAEQAIISSFEAQKNSATLFRTLHGSCCIS